MSLSKKNNSSLPVSKVIGVQFSLLSPDEIRKASVAQITTRNTYVNNKPVIGGLMDPRMGVLESGLICPTDNHDYIQTPGYFGHIELARPVFLIQYMGTILKTLRCVCFKCSRLLVSKKRNNHISSLDPKSRWKWVVDNCKSVKTCGKLTEDGCGCKQPTRLKKVDLATIIAEWGKEEKISIEDEANGAGNEGDGEGGIKSFRITPEDVIKIFKRISDEDVLFMGFNPVFSRPEWMITSVCLVPPPAVRPSVKQDSNQRSEDDLSHILTNIIKFNKILADKIEANAPANIIEDWTAVLQYHMATMIDNNLSGVEVAAQRSGRPLKSIMARLKGKEGRMRHNLMAKRVDFSARSVIGADPNISIQELGVPLKIAKNLTKPIVVNATNREFLYTLIHNGPDVYPGAKILEKKSSGLSITLRFIDLASIVLEEGDVVHRHLMDGDYVLFNRQPTLHRMSMQGHRVRVMMQGDTFRLNVAVTRPYNADRR